MNTGVPKMNISEEGNDVVVKIDIPGINEKNLELSVKNDLLKVSVSEKAEKKVRDGDYVGNEWVESSFEGVVSLPCEVVPMLVHHSYDGKVLEVRLKKV